MATRSCTVDGCDKPYRASGYCSIHYHRWRRHGDPLWDRPPRNRRPPTCEVDGCDLPHRARGLCERHYRLARAAEAPECSVDGCTRPVRSLGLCQTHRKRLTQRGSTDDRPGDHADVAERMDRLSVGVPGGCIEWTGHVNDERYGYGRIRWEGRLRLAHVVSWLLWNDADVVPEGLQVRHLCNNRLCINPLHLEVGTASQNTYDSLAAGTHSSQKVSAYMAARIRAVSIRHGIEPAKIDAVLAEVR